jgi:acyl-CoA reductase-like NAD-dependent aldehyde dehydrogenase
VTEQLVIGGRRVDGAGATGVIEPATGEPMAEVAEAGPEEAREAVRVAFEAFEDGRGPGRTRPNEAEC